MKYFFNITVKGTGKFPLDMLRYSQCYPRCPDDTWLMEESFKLPREQREITVCLEGTYGTALNCVERFASFGWIGEITYEEKVA